MPSASVGQSSALSQLLRETEAASGRRGLWYVAAAVWSGPANLRAGAVVAAASLLVAATGCGGGERRDAGVSDRTYTVDIVRASFPTRQHLADNPAFVLTVRNAGDTTIPNLVVTLHGFAERSGEAAQADPRELVWLVGESPAGAVTAIEDAWAAGPLQPGREVALRWRVTPLLTGTHVLDYTVAADLAGAARTRLASGGHPRGSITVRVDGRPPRTRVDPRTGRVIGE
jgi:hypothetical protein